MPRTETKVKEIAWSGRIVAVQPRIRLMRSFDQRYQSYHGYVLHIDGTYAERAGEFLIAVGREAHEKYRFCVGMELRGLSIPVDDPRLETAGFYKTSRIKVGKQAGGGSSAAPPFLGVPPDLETYRSRGHRRLDVRIYESKCKTCIWGCRMPVEMIIDQWNPSRKRHRFETFCYGPKTCPFYRAGAPRRVPGRKGMSYTEEDWVDEEATSHRGPDD
jgi:hypothetical protein